MPSPLVMSSSEGFVDMRGGLGTRFRGPAMVGQLTDNTSGGPKYKAGGVIVIQSTAAPANQVITTSATNLQTASYVYIPVLLGGPIAGSTAEPPYSGAGTPLIWDDTLKTLTVWSSGSGAWLSLVNTSSQGGVAFTST